MDSVSVTLQAAWTAHSFDQLSHSSAAVGRHGNCWNSRFHVL